MMEKKKKMDIIKQKLKSNKGFTMQDLIAGCIILTIFVATITALLTSVYKINIKTRLTSQMATYAVEILEDIDKISYSDAQKRTGAYYKGQFQIPAGYTVELSFSDYGEGIENVQDVMKIVKLNISYTLAGDTVNYGIQRLKIKEI